MSDVVTRFAPSPTGMLHLGNVRTALLNWLFAHRHGGRFLLRFEDTDRDRSETHYIDTIQNDLVWLGLDWDGEPLFQSAHHDKHTQALRQLAEQNDAYRCFCSEGQLNLDRKLATSRGLPPRYSGRCKALSSEESRQRAESEPFVWRLAIRSDAGEVVVRDELRSDVHFTCADLDDPVVVRSDGTFTFLLPNAVDDALDGITHTMRGDDHLTNSAYQVWLLQRLGYAAPVYFHHGLLLGEDGAKLSKRTGSHSVESLREQGLFPEALLQAMARLGHPNIPEECLTTNELAEHFSAEHVSTSSVRWSDEQMWRWHARFLHTLDPVRLAPLLKPFSPNLTDEQLIGLAGLVEGNLSRVEDVKGYARIVDVGVAIGDDDMQIVREAGADFFKSALDIWSELESDDWKGWTDAVKAATGRKGRQLFLPLRMALTGMQHGPEMSHVVSFLGREGVTLRLEDTLERTGS
ncbi:MAG: glutamate--tRNA ligase [Mariprofundaceae bacterium]|nr:glutamate--tRNA ligase [Mariprofundaceae bacterium]